MIHLSLQEHQLVVRGDDGDFAPRHESQLAYWGSQYDAKEKTYAFAGGDISDLAKKVVGYFDAIGIHCCFDGSIRALLDAQGANQRSQRQRRTAEG